MWLTSKMMLGITNFLSYITRNFKPISFFWRNGIFINKLRSNSLLTIIYICWDPFLLQNIILYHSYHYIIYFRFVYPKRRGNITSKLLEHESEWDLRCYWSKKVKNASIVDYISIFQNIKESRRLLFSQSQLLTGSIQYTFTL